MAMAKEAVAQTVAADEAETATRTVVAAATATGAIGAEAIATTEPTTKMSPNNQIRKQMNQNRASY